MSATVMRFPRKWAALVEPLRRRVGPLADVKFGIGLNWNRLGEPAAPWSPAASVDCSALHPVIQPGLALRWLLATAGTSGG